MKSGRVGSVDLGQTQMGREDHRQMVEKIATQQEKLLFEACHQVISVDWDGVATAEEIFGSRHDVLAIDDAHHAEFSVLPP